MGSVSTGKTIWNGYEELYKKENIMMKSKLVIAYNTYFECHVIPSFVRDPQTDI